MTQVINEHTNRKQDIKVYEELDSFMNDLGLKSLEKRNWKKSFEDIIFKELVTRLQTNLILVVT